MRQFSTSLKKRKLYGTDRFLMVITVFFYHNEAKAFFEIEIEFKFKGGSVEDTFM